MGRLNTRLARLCGESGTVSGAVNTRRRAALHWMWGAYFVSINRNDGAGLGRLCVKVKPLCNAGYGVLCPAICLDQDARKMAAEFSAVDRDIRTTPGNTGFFVRGERQALQRGFMLILISGLFQVLIICLLTF